MVSEEHHKYRSHNSKQMYREKRCFQGGAERIGNHLGHKPGNDQREKDGPEAGRYRHAAEAG